MKSVIFIAPPSAGKGSQSEKLMEMGYIHISTGDMLREEIKKGSPIGLEINDIMASGNLVKDEIVFKLIKDKLQNNNKPFILDGFPRTIEQAHLLDTLFKELDITDYEVVYLNISLEVALKRALGRLTCECGASYNIYFDEFKPQNLDVCDKCGKKLIKRTDDNETSFKVRFNTFIENSKPILEFYQNKNKLHNIDALLSAKEITDRIKEILK